MEGTGEMVGSFFTKENYPHLAHLTSSVSQLLRKSFSAALSQHIFVVFHSSRKKGKQRDKWKKKKKENPKKGREKKIVLYKKELSIHSQFTRVPCRGGRKSSEKSAMAAEGVGVSSSAMMSLLRDERSISLNPS